MAVGVTTVSSDVEIACMILYVPQYSAGWYSIRSEGQQLVVFVMGCRGRLKIQ